MKKLLIYFLLVPTVSYGMAETQKKIISDQVRIYHSVENPRDLFSKFKVPDDVKQFAIHIIQTQNIKHLPKLKKEDDVVTFYNPKAYLTLNFRDFDKGMLIVGEKSVELKTVESRKDLWNIFVKNARKPKNFSFFSIFIGVANAESDVATAKPEEETGVGAFAWFHAVFDKIEHTIHLCDVSRKAIYQLVKEHCDSIDEIIPLPFIGAPGSTKREKQENKPASQ